MSSELQHALLKDAHQVSVGMLLVNIVGLAIILIWWWKRREV